MKKFDFSKTPLLLLLILGGAFIYAGLFGNESFLSKLAGIRLSWFSIASTAITVWFLLGWRKIYLGFKENSMDEYETALAARYMRMTFFVAVTLWAWAFFSGSKYYPKFQFDLSQCLGGTGSPRLVIVVVAVFVALIATTTYFAWKWFELKFRP